MIGNGMEMPRAYPEYHALNVVTALSKRENFEFRRGNYILRKEKGYMCCGKDGYHET